MKKRISEQARIKHMLDAITEIQEFVEGTVYEDYLADRKLQLAVTRLIEIIGEASNHVSEDIRNRFTNIEWHILTGIRNVIVHEYFGIDYDIIWTVIQQDIPQLRTKLEYLLEHITKESE
ncbi:DUF86 domain-containing protein [Spirosoma daeguense]